MNSIWTIAKSWIFDKGAKVAAGAGLIAILLDIVNRISENSMTTKVCLELGEGGALLLLAGFLVLVAFKSEAPKRPYE